MQAVWRNAAALSQQPFHAQHNSSLAFERREDAWLLYQRYMPPRRQHSRAATSKAMKVLANAVWQAVGTDLERHWDTRLAGPASKPAASFPGSWPFFSYFVRRLCLKRLGCSMGPDRARKRVPRTVAHRAASLSCAVAQNHAFSGSGTALSSGAPSSKASSSASSCEASRMLMAGEGLGWPSPASARAEATVCT